MYSHCIVSKRPKESEVNISELTNIFLWFSTQHILVCLGSDCRIHVLKGKCTNILATNFAHSTSPP